MRIRILLFVTIGFSNLIFGQIKSEKQVEFRLYRKADEKRFHRNTSKDTCVIFWKEYNRSGKVIKEYDFPSDRCWKINGPWEHHYFYDDKGRIIEHRDFGGEEGKERTLMRDYFYSYPHPNEPYKANEFILVYDFRAGTKSEEEKIDTFFLNSVNTSGMVDLRRTSWQYDTVRFKQCNFIFRRDFERDKKLFTPKLVFPILAKTNVKEFEIALIQNIGDMSVEFTKVYQTDESYFCKFEVEELNRKTKIKLSKFFIEIKYEFINEFGDCYLSLLYECYRNGTNLTKFEMVKSYIEYFK